MNNTNDDHDQGHVNALRERVEERMSREGMGQRALATIVGASQQVLSRWLRGVGRDGETDAVTEALSRWMSATTGPVPTEVFVPTPAAKKVLATLRFARRMHDMVCVYGGPGVGKTRAVRHFQATSPEGVWVATMSPSTSALVAALEEIAEAVGVRDATGGARRLFNAIRREVTGRGGIIVIDESQHLSMGAVEELRSLHDACGVALALVGNETSYARLTGGARTAGYAQIHSRLGMRMFLHKPTPADVAAICKALGVTTKDALAFLERLSQRPGALRAVTKCVLLAQEMADDGVVDVTVEELQDACRQLGMEA
jgi:hypothetical protein